MLLLQSLTFARLRDVEAFALAGLKIMHGAVFEVRTAVLNPLGEFTFIETPLAADLESPR